MSIINFLYQDEFIFLINKPPLIHSVIVRGSEKSSIAAELLAKTPSLAKVSLKAEDAGLINRLDFETSGILIGAKTKKVWEALNLLLKKGYIEKKYLVIVEGKIPAKKIVKTFIGSKSRSAKKVRVYKTAPSKSDRALLAESQFTRIAYLEKSGFSLAEVTVATGRRHQIRAHAGYFGHPLVGDKLYGSKKELPIEASSPFILHAESVKFKHPFKNLVVNCKAPTPQWIGKIFPKLCVPLSPLW